MSDTIEESLRSILDQIDDRFEVFLFDESNDGSIEILRQLKKEYENFRFEHIEPDPKIRIGKARNISLRKARGKYVLLQLDMDDKYKEGVIKDFVKIFHRIEDKIGHDFFLNASGINIAKKGFFLNEVGGYKNIGRGEDKELWRRLLRMNRMIILDHEEVCEEIGYYRGPLAKIRAFYETVRNEFKYGVSLGSYIRWCFTKLKYIPLIPVTLWAYVSIKMKGKTRNMVQKKFRDRMEFLRAIRNKKMTLNELEEKYSFEIDKNNLERPNIWFGLN